MPNRRAFIQSGFAVSALAASPFAVRGASVARPTILFERRCTEGEAFAAAAARHGAEAFSIVDEIGSIWMNGLETQLKSMPSVIAGLTSGGPLFCLELLGRDYGLRPVYRIEHRPLANGRIEHVDRRAPASSTWAQALQQAGRQWPATAAELAVNSISPPLEFSDLPLVHLQESGQQYRPSMYTWLLATDTSRQAILTRY